MALTPPLFDPGDEIPMNDVMAFDVPGVHYISQKGIEYYSLDSPPPAEPDAPVVTAPVSQHAELHIVIKGFVAEMAEQGPQARTIKGLVYNAPAEGTEEVYFLVGTQEGSPYLNGKVLFFQYLYNPDPRLESESVHRLAALGLTQDESFGFFRVIDSFGQGLPDIHGLESDFQVWSSPVSHAHGQGAGDYGPFYYKELVVEAGSPATLQEARRGPR